ncbi:hypothetical protein quinque_015768 [Culex quinquefasciatus]
MRSRIAICRIALLRAVKIVAEAVAKTQSNHARHLLANSSIRELLEKQLRQSEDTVKALLANTTRSWRGPIILSYDNGRAPEPTVKKIDPVQPVKPKPVEYNVPPPITKDAKVIADMMKVVSSHGPSSTPEPTATPTPIDLPQLSSVAKQRKVPFSRVAHLASFGNLFAGLGLGTINELAKGALGLGGTLDPKQALFSPANAERIVDTLCKVRGAALKIGQIPSIQDSNVVSPQLIKALERVRQIEKQLVQEFGPDWRKKLATFDMTPFAAASIGQVHLGVLHDGTEVAIKIQYPGRILELSRKMGFLTGYETTAMENAHVVAVLIGKQSTTKKIAALVPVMIAHRLCPPPKEIYSLHRKLSGVFLLCARLNAKIDCRLLFQEVASNYKIDYIVFIREK